MHLKILELEQMDWLCRDMAYMRNVTTRLENLALKGAQIDVVFSTANSTVTFRNFLLRLENLRYLKSVNIHFLNADRINDLIPCVYGIPDYCVAVGIDSGEPSIPIHTNLFSDYLNAHKYSLFFDQVIKVFGITALVSDKNSQIEEIFKTVENTCNLKQDMVFFSDYLSSALMSEELIIAILDDNNIDEMKKELCLQYCRTLRKCILALPQTNTMTFYTNLHALEEAIGFDYSNEYELSAICGVTIQKSKKQFIQQIKQFIAFLEQHDNVRLVIRYGGYTRMRSYSWLKMKLWESSINT